MTLSSAGEKKEKRKRKRKKKMSPVYQRLPGLITSKILLCGFHWKCEKLLKHFSSCLEKKKKKSLLKGCSNLFYCGLFISGEKAVTRRSPTDHQPCQGPPGFGGRTLVRELAERVGPPLARRGKASGSSAFLWKRQPQHNAECSAQGSADTSHQILFE